MRSSLMIGLAGLALLAVSGCSNSGNSGYYDTNDPLDDKTPAVIRQQARDVWRSMNSTMRDAICYDVAVLDPKAAIALLQVGGDELGPGEAQIAYYEYRDLCN